MDKITLSHLINMYKKFQAMPTCPDIEQFPLYGRSHVFDQDKTVRWNREEVARRNEARVAERKRLEDLQMTKYKEMKQHILQYIMQETNVNEVEAEYFFDCMLNISDHTEDAEKLLGCLTTLIDFYMHIQNSSK